MTVSNLIALDADGVLVDYHEGYARAWAEAFGVRPAVRDAQAYLPMDYFDVPTLNDAEYRHLVAKGFTAQLWRTLPALEGALEACECLQEAGYRLVCVTALPEQHQADRVINLRSLGFNFEAVHAVGKPALPHTNPKKFILRKLHPVAFVDDYLGYLQGMKWGTWRALIDVRPHFSPNYNPCYTQPHSRHSSLIAFTRHWLATRGAAVV